MKSQPPLNIHDESWGTCKLRRDPATLARCTLQPSRVFHTSVAGAFFEQNGALDAAIKPRMEAVSQVIIIIPDVIMHAERRALW